MTKAMSLGFSLVLLPLVSGAAAARTRGPGIAISRVSSHTTSCTSCTSSRSRRATLVSAAAATSGLLPRPFAALASYGEYAKTDGTQGGAAGDRTNECLFAMPGTGICTVYKSSEPQLYASPDKTRAMDKLVNAAGLLNGLGEQIEGTRWTAISQTLGASRDLREAIGFLTASSPAAEKAAKSVFKDLDGIQLATQKKDAAIANKFFGKYSSDMPLLLKALGDAQ